MKYRHEFSCGHWFHLLLHSLKKSITPATTWQPYHALMYRSSHRHTCKYYIGFHDAQQNWVYLDAYHTKIWNLIMIASRAPPALEKLLFLTPTCAFTFSDIANICKHVNDAAWYHFAMTIMPMYHRHIITHKAAKMILSIGILPPITSFRCHYDEFSSTERRFIIIATISRQWFFHCHLPADTIIRKSIR